MFIKINFHGETIPADILPANKFHRKKNLD